jgi:hypothetical protein
VPLDQTGLTSIEARNLLDSAGPNAVADVAQHPAQRALRKLWAPVPWMLEAAIDSDAKVFYFFLHKRRLFSWSE